MTQNESKPHALDSISVPSNSLLNGTPSSAVTLSTSSSEFILYVVNRLKMFRIRKNDVGNVVSQELVIF